VVDHFPIPPEAGVKIPLPGGPGRSKGWESRIAGMNKKPMDEKELDRML